MRNLIRAAAVLALALTGLVSDGAAQAKVGPELAPASTLLFPFYDARTTAGQATVLTVTNTNSNRMVVPTNSLLTGAVQLHYYFQNCTVVNDIQRTLTPNDTIAELVNVLITIGANEKGYALVVAEDPETGNPIDFDYLIGDAIMIDVAGNRTWQYQALGFRALPVERGETGTPGVDASNAGFLFTDPTANGGDGSGDVDFNGLEYAYFADNLLLSSFLQNTGASTLFDNEVALAALYASDVRIELSGNIYDNNEDPTSWNNSFTCWTLWNLYSDIGAAVGVVGTDPGEEAIGWLRISSDRATDTLTGGVMTNPGIAGVMVQKVTSSGFMFGHLLHYTGLARSGTNWQNPTYPPQNLTP